MDFPLQRMSTTPQLLVVIATYNEVENLPRLVNDLNRLIPNVSIVVVDDNSPDGTGKWCEERSTQDKSFHHLGRAGKLGLGSATLDGLRFGRDQGFEYIATMDADFSHAPESLAAMWKEAIQFDSNRRGKKLGALIGSRYVRGGDIRGWPWHRRIASRFVNRLTRALLKLPTQDNTGAFRIYRTQSLCEANVFDIKTTGYAYLEELLFLLHHAGFELHEFPITFEDRKEGSSKASVFEGVNVLRNILRLRFRP